MDLYSEIILDYFKNPRNKGPLNDATISAIEHNTTCGDKITAHLKISSTSSIDSPTPTSNTPDSPTTPIIEKATFEGEGCAISQSSVSMLTEILAGKSLDEIKNMDNEKIYEMLGVPISPGRVKCALLGLVAFKKAIILHQTNAKKD